MSDVKCVIGILGGIASGKSTLAKIFSEFGARIVDADQIGHRLLENPQVKERIREVWGEQALAPDGSVDRLRLGNLVFDRQEELGKLSAIVHPLLVREIQEWLAESTGPVVLDAALLDEFSLTSSCDYLIFVEADSNLRCSRAALQRGWSPGEVQRRETFQLPLEVKRKKAHSVIWNNGNLQEFREKAGRVWASWGLPSSAPSGATLEKSFPDLHQRRMSACPKKK